MQDVKSAFVGRKPGALDFHPTERPHVNVAVRLATPWATPVLQLHQFFGAVCNEIIDDILVAQPVPADDGVFKMLVEAIVCLRHAGGATLGGDCVAAHWIDLGDQSNRKPGVCIGRSNRSPQARATSPDDCDIGLDQVHDVPLPRAIQALSLPLTRRCRQHHRVHLELEMASRKTSGALEYE